MGPFRPPSSAPRALTHSTSATTEDEADENARNNIDFDDVIAAYRDNGTENFDIEIISTERV